MNRKFNILAFIFLAFIIGITHLNAHDNIKISILTCAPGMDIYSIYGHNAIRVNDQAGTDLVYNYGTFDFKTKGFIYKFMRGKLPYTLDVAEYGRFLEEYNYFKRSVTEQVLDLDSLQKQKVLEYLAINMQPENRTYKYDFFMDNCATRLRDIIDKNIDTNKWDQSKASGKTFRDIIKEYQTNLPWTNFGIDLIIGAPADRPTSLSEETFIPDYLSTAIRHANIGNNPSKKLELSQHQVLTFDHPKTNGNFILSPYFLFLLLLLVEINLFVRNLTGKGFTWIKKYDNVWMMVLAIVSILMMFMWFGTDHIPTKYNWNLLWASPLLIIWWYRASIKNLNTNYLSYLLLGMMSISIMNAIPGLRFLPQYFHPVVILICLILMLKIWRIDLGSRQPKGA